MYILHFQVRRWQAWDQKISKEETDRSKFSKNGKKQVQFLNGEDGEPWVRNSNPVTFMKK